MKVKYRRLVRNLVSIIFCGLFFVEITQPSAFASEREFYISASFAGSHGSFEDIAQTAERELYFKIEELCILDENEVNQLPLKNMMVTTAGCGSVRLKKGDFETIETEFGCYPWTTVTATLICIEK
jgi:hypothetical protein